MIKLSVKGNLSSNAKQFSDKIALFLVRKLFMIECPFHKKESIKNPIKKIKEASFIFRFGFPVPVRRKMKGIFEWSEYHHGRGENVVWDHLMWMRLFLPIPAWRHCRYWRRKKWRLVLIGDRVCIANQVTRASCRRQERFLLWSEKHRIQPGSGPACKTLRNLEKHQNVQWP